MPLRFLRAPEPATWPNAHDPTFPQPHRLKRWVVRYLVPWILKRPGKVDRW